MSSRSTPWSAPEGPFRADHIRDGDDYELSSGHAIHCMTAGGRHGQAHQAGAIAIATAAVAPQQTGADVGIAWNDGKNLRAPDLVAGLELGKPGWVGQAPPLAVEYADLGQDEAALALKIAELLEFGTRMIWVVRLTGPLRVEVHEPGIPVRVVDADGELVAPPDILTRPVAVRALIDPEVAVEAALHNILARKGYRDLDAVRAEGRQEGHQEGHREGRQAGRQEASDETRALLLAEIAARGWQLSPTLHARVTACIDHPTLLRWLLQVRGAADVEAALR